MRAIAIRVVLMAFVAGAAGMAFASQASAAQLVAEINTPGEFLVGQTAPVRVSLRYADTNQPVAGVVVAFYTDNSFGGVAGKVNVGSVVTDESGVAVLEYEPRTSSTHELRLEYLAPGASAPEVATVSIVVAGTVQLSHSTSGIRVPGLNVWLIMAILGGVWTLLLSVGWRVFAITRAAEAPAWSEPLRGARTNPQ